MTVDPFPTPFVELLRLAVARVTRMRGARVEHDLRAKRRLPSAGGTFRGHREYAPGDDLRRVDWNAFARTGDLFTKVFEEDDHRAATIHLDRSPSMAAGTPPRYLGAQRLAALLIGIAWVRLDAVRVVLGSEASGVLSLVGPVRLESILARLRGAEIREAEAGGDEPMAIASAILARGLGTVYWLSDFADPDSYRRAFQLLRRRGIRVVGMLPAIPDDTQPPAVGWTRILDPETGAEEPMLVDAALRTAVATELRRLAKQQDALFSEFGCPLVRVPLPGAHEFRLSSWLATRWLASI